MAVEYVAHRSPWYRDFRSFYLPDTHLQPVRFHIE